LKYYIIAGEASGDLHGANLIRAIKARDAQAEIRCWGGDKMAAAGGHLVKHIRELAFMGFLEVVKHLPTILGNISFCKKDMLAYKPDVVILIDYPGFNFRLFKFIKEHHFKLFYYISPQLWAWKAGRVKQVRQYVDRMFVIFPFEKEFYAKHGVEVDFVGHPLLDELTQSTVNGQRSTGPLIVLLPGSRKQEISKLLPEYLKVIPHFPEYRFVIAGISGLGKDFYQSMTGNAKVEIEWDNTYGLLNGADAAIVTSGTATLETALHNVPEVVCYKASPLSYLIARQLIKGIEYICIVNLIANKKVVTELIQSDVTPENLKREVNKLLDTDERKVMLRGYEEVRILLGEAGASARAADLMIGYLKK
jgi:lipid-A-disaccharide synthase